MNIIKAIYPKGTKVKVKYGHLILEGNKVIDIRPELTTEIGIVEYTYGEKSETDSKYDSSPRGYKQYSLYFEGRGSICWFHEYNLIPINE